MTIRTDSRRSKRWISGVALALSLGAATVGALSLGVLADEPAWPATEVAPLRQLQPYIGQWRGVGQLRRGSSQGAWTEQGEWIGSFDKNQPAFTFRSAEGKYLQAARLRSQDGSAFELEVAAADDAKRLYRGGLDEDRLVLTATQPDMQLPSRITIRQVAGGDRMLILYERQVPGADRFTRIAEVGYTRVGSDFGQGATMVECIVTGGKATIPVTHLGKTYYVCCSGCRDLFNEDPDRVLAEYVQRSTQKK